MHGSLFLCQTASGIRFMRQQIAGTTPTRLRSFHTAGGIRSHVTTISTGRAPTPIGFNTASGMRSHVTSEVAHSLGISEKVFQYRKRYEVTCDSVSGRPQKQKAQIMVLENLLETKHAIALFRLSLHTPRICNDPAKPYAARLAAIRGKSENLPRFFASERFSCSSYCSMVSHFCQTKTASRFKRKGRR